MAPITIVPSDEEQKQKYKNANMVDKDGNINFKTDDHSGYFEIYRLEEHPEKYEDFSNSLIASVKTDVSDLTSQEATTAAFVDDVRPNKKYYYIFRVVDNHGHVSNPTPVYRVELIDENGSIYPIVETVDFVENKKRRPTKQMRKYLQISPNLSQVLVNEEKSGLEGVESAAGVKEVFLGRMERTLFGKSFKIRLISKNTGKIIDFNVNFQSKDERTSGFEK
jgi:hypothetical protein